jgi:hypothetical protein
MSKKNYNFAQIQMVGNFNLNKIKVNFQIELTDKIRFYFVSLELE